MPQTIDHVEYLNATESARLLGISYVTFKLKRDEYGLQSYVLLGKGNAKFYKKADVEGIQRMQPEKKKEPGS